MVVQKDHITEAHSNDTGSTEADGTKSQWRITKSNMGKLSVVEANEQEAVLGVLSVKKRKFGDQPSNNKNKSKKK